MPPNTTPDHRRETLETLGLAALSLLFTVVCVALLHVQYLVNDDTGIVSFITGGYTVPYVGILLTGPLHLAYAAAPAVPWFGLLLYALHTLALFAWLRLVWKVFRPWPLAAACTLAVLGYYLAFIVYLDFTATSVMLCMAGVCWACIQVLERSPGWARSFWPGLLFALGMVVRPQGAPGALAYALPFAVIAMIAGLREQPFSSGIRRLMIAGLVFFAPAALAYTADAAWRYYSLTPQEAQYEAFNKAGTELDHISHARRKAILADPSLLAAVHMTSEDYEYFIDWKFLDERVYTPEALNMLWENAPRPDSSTEELSNLVRGRLPPGNLLILLLAACWPLFLLCMKQKPWESLVGLLTPVYGIGLTTFMYLEYAFIGRLEIPFEIGLGFSALLVGSWFAARAESASRVPLRLAAGIGLMLALSGASFSVHTVLKKQRQTALGTSRLEARIDDLNAHYAGSIILIQPSALELNQLSPLKVADLRFQPINLGWNTFSPRFYQQISGLGIQHGYELVDAIIGHQNTYMMGNRTWCNSLLRYATDYPQRQVEIVPAVLAPRGITLFRLEEKQKQ